MNTPFGIANLWLDGDLITRFVAIALLLCSIVTWVILLTRLWGLRNLRKLKLELELWIDKIDRHSLFIYVSWLRAKVQKL